MFGSVLCAVLAIGQCADCGDCGGRGGRAVRARRGTYAAGSTCNTCSSPSGCVSCGGPAAAVGCPGCNGGMSVAQQGQKMQAALNAPNLCGCETGASIRYCSAYFCRYGCYINISIVNGYLPSVQYNKNDAGEIVTMTLDYSQKKPWTGDCPVFNAVPVETGEPTPAPLPTAPAASTPTPAPLPAPNTPGPATSIHAIPAPLPTAPKTPTAPMPKLSAPLESSIPR